MGSDTRRLDEHTAPDGRPDCDDRQQWRRDGSATSTAAARVCSSVRACASDMWSERPTLRSAPRDGARPRLRAAGYRRADGRREVQSERGRQRRARVCRAQYGTRDTVNDNSSTCGRGTRRNAPPPRAGERAVWTVTHTTAGLAPACVVFGPAGRRERSMRACPNHRILICGMVRIERGPREVPAYFVHTCHEHCYERVFPFGIPHDRGAHSTADTILLPSLFITKHIRAR